MLLTPSPEVHTTHPIVQHMFYIDNKGVVTKANNQIEYEYEYDYPFNTLEPDWDVITQLAKYLERLSSKLKKEHVKSNQDDKYNS
eukprot:4883036-Ditylum_brightwellii.AAC.1